jgi:hypothetical protein
VRRWVKLCAPLLALESRKEGQAEGTFTEQNSHASVAVEVICDLIKLDTINKATLPVKSEERAKHCQQSNPTVCPLLIRKSEDPDLPSVITVMLLVECKFARWC